jgi:hypothetical protein
MKLTYEAILDDPGLLARIREDAHRARAEAMYRLVVKPVKDLLAGHAARPHLARQG